MEQSSHQAHAHHHHGNPFLIPFILIALFAMVELAGGVWTHSLALLSDGWHMVSDVMALGLAMLAAYRTAHARANHRESRAELMASCLNAVIMLVVIVWIVLEALARLHQPKLVQGGYVTLIAFVGLIVNIIVARRLHHAGEDHGDDNLNQRAAFLHVMGDLLGSVAAIVAGAVIYFTGWLPIDPMLSLLISLLLTWATLRLMMDIYRAITGKRAATKHHGHQH